MFEHPSDIGEAIAYQKHNMLSSYYHAIFGQNIANKVLIGERIIYHSRLIKASQSSGLINP
jgi:hypothetical protein